MTTPLAGTGPVAENAVGADDTGNANTGNAAGSSGNTNRVPVFGQSSYSKTFNEAVNQGDVVATVSATDADAGDTLTYSIISGNAENLFAIDSNGRVTIADINARYESIRYTLTVQVIDGNGGIATTDLVVDNFVIGTGTNLGNTLYGDADDNTLYGYGGNDTLYGDAIALYKDSTGGADTLYGGSGDDTLYGDGASLLDDSIGGADTLYGGSGDDDLYGDAIALYKDSTGGADTLYGGSGNDRLYGDGSLVASGSISSSSSSSSADTLYGGSGDDELYGDGNSLLDDSIAGADTLYGGSGNDTLYGDGYWLYEGSTSGNDTLYGGNGADTLYGDGRHFFRGHSTSGNDTLYGGSGDDRLYGDGYDFFRGSSWGGNDTLYGGSGDDWLYGDGYDFFRGSSWGGNDTLYGGSGDDTLTGNGGADIFVLHMDISSSDTVEDFNPTIGSTGEGDKIRVHVDDDSAVTTIAGLGLRVAQGNLKLAHQSSSYTSTTNTIIYKVKGEADSATNGETDDVAIMMLRDFSGLTFDMFEVKEFALTATGTGKVTENVAGADIEGITLTVDGVYTPPSESATISDDRFELVRDNADAAGNKWKLKLKDGVALDHSIEASLALDISIANDAGMNPKMVSVTLNVNEAPTFNQESYTANIAASATIGDTISDETMATDVDGDTLTYSIIRGNVENFFAIDEKTGEVTIVDLNARYESILYELRVQVSDGNGGIATTELVVTNHKIGTGTDVSNTLNGGSDDDALYGYGGDDTLYGDGNRLYAGSVGGADTLYGGSGHDRLYGDSNRLYAGSVGGADTLYGGSGDDSLYGDGSSLRNGSVGGADTLYGGSGDDSLYGDGSSLRNGSVGGADTLYGGSGDDTLYGDGASLLNGSTGGADTLYGGSGDDTLYGDGSLGNGSIGGADTLYGGSGHDALTGNSGADIFVLNVDESNSDTVWDFSPTINGVGEGDKIRVHVDDDSTITTIAGLGLRVAQGNIKLAHHHSSYTSTTNTIIYKVKGEADTANGESDDVAIMLLRNFSGLSFDMFEMVEIALTATGTGQVTENATGVDTGITLSVEGVYVPTSADFSVSDARFEVVAAGANWKLKLKDNASLDYETASSLNLTVSIANDAGTTSKTASVTVNVANVDEAPAFNAASYNASLAENVTPSGPFVQVVATDADANDTVTYSITDGNAASIFAINASGQITVKSALDYETASSHTLTIEATDNAGNTSEADVVITVIDVSDNAPAFSATSYDATVSETAASGSDVVSAPAADVDTNETLTYAITGGNVSGLFTIDGNGDITLARALDYEVARSHALTIRVTDSGGNTDTANVAITVTDVNDEAPVFGLPSYTASLAENAALNSNVIQIAATDADANDTVSYSITDGDTELFSIDANGQITLKGALDYETATRHTLTIQATDRADNTGTTTVTINVIDLNDNDPAFSEDSYEATLAEDTVSRSAVVSAPATDADNGNTLTYTITGGNGAGLFSIDSDGDITLARALDYETATRHTLTIRVTDNGGKADTANVVIAVTDINDNNPIFNEASYDQTFAENVDIDTTFFQVTATDSDTDTLTYSIVSGNSTNLFDINTGDGKITFNRALDYETATSHDLTVRVSDGINTVDTSTITITVTDVNDVAPVFSTPAVTWENGFANGVVATSTAASTVLGNLIATDGDTPTTGLTYSIAAGSNGAGFFALSTAGALSLAKTLNATSASHVLTVEVSDGIHTDTIDIDINNNNDPVFTMLNSNTGSAEEGLANIDTGITFTVTDADSRGSFSNTDFEIIGTGADKFAVVSAGVDSAGNTIWALQATQELDYAVASTYALTIKVNDSSRSATADVTVNVERTIRDVKGEVGNTIDGSDQAENIYGYGGNDIITGDNGDDVIYGGSGDDTIRGGRDHDTLYGGEGADTLYGGNGNDIFNGGIGIDTLYGKRGNDVFEIDIANAVIGNVNADIVTDFSRTGYFGADRLQIDSGDNGGNFALLRATGITGTYDGLIPDQEAGVGAGDSHTVIYHNKGTPLWSDDIVLMVLEDFNYNDFDLASMVDVI